MLNQCFVGSTPALDNLLPIYRKILTYQFSQGILENFGSSECSQVVTSVNALYALIDNIPDNYRAVFGRNPDLEQTYVEFLYMLFDGVDVDYFTYDGGYIDTLKSTPLEGKNTVEEVQALIFATNARIGAIVRTEVLNSYNGQISYTFSDLQATGVSRLIEANFYSYFSVIKGSNLGDVDTLAEIQDLVDRVNRNVEIAKIDAYTSVTVSGLTIDQLVAAGVTAGSARVGNLAGYKAVIGSVVNEAADSTEKIQNIITDVNGLVFAIDGYDNDISPISNLTAEELRNIGITGVVDENIVGYRPAIVSADATTVAKIQVLVADTNTRVATIDAYGAGASALQISTLTEIGVRPAFFDNLAGYRAAIGGADASTVAKIAALVQTVDTNVMTIDGYTLITYSALTIEALTAVGVSSTDDENLPAYSVAIGTAVDSAANTVVKIQGIVDTVNIAETLRRNLEAIEAYVSGESLSKALLEAVGVTGAITDNVGAYRSAIAAAAAGAADTTAEIQAIVTLVNAATATSTSQAAQQVQDAQNAQAAAELAAQQAAAAQALAAQQAADQLAAQQAAAQAAATAAAATAAAATAAAATAAAAAQATAVAQAQAASQAAASAAQAEAASAAAAAQAQAAKAAKDAADAKAAADKAVADAKAAADKAVADAKAAADKAVADAKAAADAKALADKAAADKAAADAKALADAKAAADAKTASDLKKALANTVKASARSAGGTFVNLDLADSYSGLKAEVLVRKPGSKTFTVLGSVALVERGYGKLFTKTVVDKGSLIRVVIGGKIVKSLTF